MVTSPPEQLGSFYLGAKYDIDSSTILDDSVNYDSRDLTTHAVCVGMTGSGKTGLCIGLLEEAAIDKVPALIIDPKGDMTNLMLQFENLSPDDFAKWINKDDAGRKGMTTEEYAASIADKWKKGIDSWGQDLQRIRNLKNAVDYTIYTPGSDAGIPINIMGSFSAPSVDFESEAEMIRERIQGTVAALLGMINLKVDPVRSKEGILLSNLFEHYWKKNEDLDLATIIKGVQSPPFQQLGVFDVDTFFPEKDRFDLAMSFNSLIASPQFKYWLEGVPMDIEQLYYTPEGKPKHSIFYIAHLSESERMFFVTLLLNSLISWMRKQSGTTSLRSLLYFDEIFGYFPPTANPPSKKPLLTILKQARAYGVGAVLVTQNPVDIDYKGLSNAGTWFIGKLQTERDKMRVLDGLEGAIAEAGAAGKHDFSKIITSLSSRVFLMHNVHDTAPIVYHTRWALSYLRGPMTRPQVKTLMASRKEDLQQNTKANLNQNISQSKSEKSVNVEVAPSLDHAVDQRYFSVWKSSSEAARILNSDEQLSLAYLPHLISNCKVRYYDSKRDIDIIENKALLVSPPDDFGRAEWKNATQLDNWEKDVFPKPDHPEGVSVDFYTVPDSMNSAKELKQVNKDLSDWLYQNKKHITMEHKDLKIYKEQDESNQSFLSRVQQAAREERDEELDTLQEKYEVKFDRIEEKIRKEEQDLDAAKADARDRKTAEMVGIAETIFSVFVRKRSRSISSATSKSRMRRKAAQKVEAAKEDLEELMITQEELEQELKEKVEEIKVKWDTVSLGVTEKEITPRRTDIKVDEMIVAWVPFWKAKDGRTVIATR
jgi:hypothetical protein